MTFPRDARVRLFLYDDEYDFRLTIKGLSEVQEKCNAGPLQIITRLQSGEYRIEEVLEVLRIGLIGGGMSPGKAYSLVNNSVGSFVEYADGDKLSPRFVAASILMAALVGPEDEPVGKQEGAET